MNNITIKAGALLLSLAGSALALAPARQFVPQWRTGDTWALKTQFRKLAAGDTHDPLAWSDPVTLVYTVASATTEGSKTNYRVHAEPRTPGM